jgi:hypothetical protein
VLPPPCLSSAETSSERRGGGVRYRADVPSTSLLYPCPLLATSKTAHLAGNKRGGRYTSFFPQGEISSSAHMFCKFRQFPFVAAAPLFIYSTLYTPIIIT